MDTNFHGSYNADDVTFLLTPIKVTKEQHFGYRSINNPKDDPEAWASEYSMSSLYMFMVRDAISRNAERVAMDTLRLAAGINNKVTGEIVVVSLVRAGTPIGVLVHRALKMMGRESYHYSISATRKRGSDPSALDFILTRHKAESIVFIDGWTGKGYIAGELYESVAGYNRTRGVNIDPTLHVLADLAGAAGLASTSDDYLIPSAMLRATICGLISASMLDSDAAEGSSPDCCYYFESLEEHDMSQFYVDAIFEQMKAKAAFINLLTQSVPGLEFKFNPVNPLAKRISDAFVDDIVAKYTLSSRNQVKPGICEANRALLTRSAARMTLLLGKVEDGHGHEVLNLHYLASWKSIHIQEDVQMPYHAAVIIRG
jgi:hypothetical protein